MNILNRILIHKGNTVDDSYDYIKDKAMIEKILNENMTYSSDINLEEEINNILEYLRDNGEFSGDAPRLVLHNGDVENARLLASKSAHFDPNDNTIHLYTEGRHARDLCTSYLHEFKHFLQNLEGRLENITTDNVTEDDNLAELEREAYEFSGMMFRKYKDSKKTKKLQKEYKEYVLNELFEKDLPNIKKTSPTEYIVGNGGDIEAKFNFIDVIVEPDSYSFKWDFTSNNKNTSAEVWKTITATSPKILQDFINSKNPKHIYIQGSIEKGSIYQYDKYIETLSNLLNNKYEIEKEKKGITLTLISEICNMSVLKRMDTMNESYEQALYYWQNLNINAVSGIERWSAIQRKVKREVLQEVYGINENYKIPLVINDVFPHREKEIHDYLSKSLHEIKLNPQNSVETNGDEMDGSFVVGDFKYIYKIHEMDMEGMGEEYTNKKFYNIYFHPEEYKESKPLGNTSSSNYIKILNTMYNIILRFSDKYKPDYIGIYSLDNNSSKNYHSLYNDLTKEYPLPGYQRKNSNLEFETGDNVKGRFIVLKKKESNIQEVCHIKSGDDPYGLNKFMREATQELALDNPKYKIYVDLDEVLVAFDDSFKEIFGESPSSYEKKYGRAKLIVKIEQQNVDFWNKLKWARDAMPLWTYIKKYSPTVITAPSGKASEIGKRKWVNYNLGTNIPVIFAKAEQKHKYSGKDKILIDDMTSTIYRWIDGGGIGIHHISTFDTLNKLKKLGL